MSTIDLASPAASLTGAQKCAILLLVLEEAQAAEMLSGMSPAEVQQVGEAMLTVAEIDPLAIDHVLDEFLARTAQVAALDSQGRQLRQRLGMALGTPRAETMIEKIGPPAAGRRFAVLDWVDGPALAKLIADEHPQAIAVILAHLPEARAAQTLDALPETLQPDVAARLATLTPVNIHDLAALEADIETKLRGIGTRRDHTQLAGTDFTAAVIKKARGRGALLETLMALNAELAAELEAQQFIFADLIGLSQKDMQLVLREVDPGQLAIAMKGADGPLKAFIFGAMSKRAASQLQDELAERGPMKRSEVEAAQRELCRTVRRLGDSGALTLPTSTEAML
ncbi:FliG C-terminal domain-containing protein [Sandarakinorhabdus sp. AAP62]|uniref:flagellar motor switch protein FliG n=1 Tax=Sandarakinorhabdus sp. AAP62 TaxID=1248916 RepID=UPI0003107199|nr:FliG C-terminal domain-containing protein [Sandarakinorhabdus sp. AAP62]